MKKIISLVMALTLMLALVSCGEPQESTSVSKSDISSAADLTKKDFIGTWVNAETNEYLIIDESNINFCDSRKRLNHGHNWGLAKIKGDTVSVMDEFTLTLTNIDGAPQLTGEMGTFITEKEAQENIVHAGLNETAKGKLFEVTVTGYEFAELLGSENTTRLFQRDVGHADAGDGKEFMIVKFDYTNLAKEKVDMVRDIQITVLYKDGYEFSSFEEENAYIFEDDMNGTFRTCWLDIGGYVMDLSPLTNGSFYIAIPVAEMVSSDTESPIQIRFDYGTNMKGGGDLSETMIIDLQ